MYDLLIKNGTIITLDNKNTAVEWVGVTGGKIVATGGRNDIADCAEHVLDLQGGTLLPGLFDSHVHVLETGIFLDSVNMEEVTSIGEALQQLKKACEIQNREWVLASGYTLLNIKEQRFPDRKELDSISNGHPVMLMSQTLHSVVLNSAALSLIAIPESGDIGKEEDGELNGMFLSDDCVFPVMSNVKSIMPESRIAGYIRKCADYAAEQGVTTMCGLFGQSMNQDQDVPLAIKLRETLPVHLEIFYQTWDIDKVKALGLPRIGGCLTLDGAGPELTMALQEPYAIAPHKRGFLLHTDEEIYTLISRAHREDLQCAFHALGERAIDQLIYLFQQVLGEQDKKDLRHRIEHFSMPSVKHMELLSELNLAASMQPAFSGLWGDPQTGAYQVSLGKQAEKMEMFPEIIKRGGRICGGSDSPVTLIDPLFGIASLINNPDPKRNISVTDALRTFTYNAAWAVHLEERKGSIAVGKDADFTIIDRNPYEYVDRREIYDMKVLYTIRGGEITFQNNKLI